MGPWVCGSGEHHLVVTPSPDVCSDCKPQSGDKREILDAVLTEAKDMAEQKSEPTLMDLRNEFAELKQRIEKTDPRSGLKDAV